MIAAVNKFRWVQRVVLIRESEILFFYGKISLALE